MARAAVHGAMTVNAAVDRGTAHAVGMAVVRSVPDRRGRDPTAPAGPAVDLGRAHDPTAVAARSAHDRGHDRDIAPLDPHDRGRRRTDVDLSSPHVPRIGDGMRARAASRHSSPARGTPRVTRGTVDRARADSCRVAARNHTAMTSPTARSEGRFPGGIDRAPDPRSHRLRHLVMARSWWPGGGR